MALNYLIQYKLHYPIECDSFEHSSQCCLCALYQQAFGHLGRQRLRSKHGHLCPRLRHTFLQANPARQC